MNRNWKNLLRNVWAIITAIGVIFAFSAFGYWIGRSPITDTTNTSKEKPRSIVPSELKTKTFDSSQKHIPIQTDIHALFAGSLREEADGERCEINDPAGKRENLSYIIKNASLELQHSYKPFSWQIDQFPGQENYSISGYGFRLVEGSEDYLQWLEPITHKTNLRFVVESSLPNDQLFAVYKVECINENCTNLESIHRWIKWEVKEIDHE